MQASNTLKKLSILCGLISSLVLAGCPKKQGQPEADEKKAAKAAKAKAAKAKDKQAKGDTKAEQVKRARAALMPLKKKLMGELKAAMKAGGFEEAIDACKIKAPQITKELNEAGIHVGRTSHKVRNPQNATKAEWLKKALEIYQKTTVAQLEDKKVEPYQLAELGDKVGYAEPIYVKSLCLSCHGGPKQVPPKLAKLIDKAYPKDQARGFAEGGFRGLFWVELPKKGAK